MEGALSADDRVGLCARCRHCDVVTSDKGSTFWRCRLNDGDPRFPKYPRLPVLACPGFRARAGDAQGHQR